MECAKKPCTLSLFWASPIRRRSECGISCAVPGPEAQGAQGGSGGRAPRGAAGGEGYEAEGGPQEGGILPPRGRAGLPGGQPRDAGAGAGTIHVEAPDAGRAARRLGSDVYQTASFVLEGFTLRTTEALLPSGRAEGKTSWCLDTMHEIRLFLAVRMSQLGNLSAGVSRGQKTPSETMIRVLGCLRRSSRPST